MTPYRWASRGDVNAFFGLILDNLATLTLIVSLLLLTGHFSAQFVIGRMLPGTALGVLVGDLVYTWLAFRLARRTGRDDVTAMPLGLDTPSTFAVPFLVLKPAAELWLRDHTGDANTAMVFAWHVGAVVLVLSGLFKTLVAPLGNVLRRWVPRAGLFGSLGAIALALIAFLPLLSDIGPAPLVGFVTLTVVLVTLVARQALPGNFPAALAAFLLGLAAYGGWRLCSLATGWPLVPPLGEATPFAELPSLPAEAWTSAWWQTVVAEALGRLPIMLPFALATVIGGVDCTESAAAAGDTYDTGQILLTEGLATIVAGAFGGVIQTTPYIGHPAYKAMGGRAAYTLAVALVVGAAGWFGGFATFFHLLPPSVVFPILVFIGLEIAAQSYAALPKAHYPAVAIAVLPALAYLMLIPIHQIIDPNPPAGHVALMVHTLRVLANGFVITGLLWASFLAELLDGRARRAAAYLGVAAVCSLFGLMHSPFHDARIDWPWTVAAEMIRTTPPAVHFQTPWHWAGAYLLAAGVVLGLNWLQPFKAHPEPHGVAPTPAESLSREEHA